MFNLCSNYTSNSCIKNRTFKFSTCLKNQLEFLSLKMVSYGSMVISTEINEDDTPCTIRVEAEKQRRRQAAERGADGRKRKNFSVKCEP